MAFQLVFLRYQVNNGTEKNTYIYLEGFLS